MLNPFFQQGSSGEQSLVQDLINEQLRMYGVEVHYMPRKYMTEKTLMREVVESKFDDAYPIEAYVESFDGYGDNPTLLSKFGIQQTNEITLIISKERFENYISPLMKNESNVKLSTRPKEGDLIYFPLGDRLFEIKYVEHERPFYQLQKNYVYELRCELFRIEDEVIDTGVDEIDDTLEGIEGADGDIIFQGVGLQKFTLVGTATSATAVTTVVDGAIRFIDITNRGSGYLTRPRVAISSAPADITGRLFGDRSDAWHFTDSGGNITGSTGSGYEASTVYDLVGGSGSGARIFVSSVSTGTPVGAIVAATSGLRIVFGGSGYSVGDVLQIDGGNGGAHIRVARVTTLGGVTGIASAFTLGNIVVCTGSAEPNSNQLVIQSAPLVNPGSGYTVAPKIQFFTNNTDGKGTGAAGTSVLTDFGAVGIVTVTGGGSGYTTAPTITFTGVSTVSAAATAVVSAAGTISAIYLTNAGAGYTVPPTISIAVPGSSSSGNFSFNETITGGTSGATAKVRKWNAETVELDVYDVDGIFLRGETITGSSSSATSIIRVIDDGPGETGYEDNDGFETEADEILDFSEANPFGTP